MTGCPARLNWMHFLEDRLPVPEQQALEAHAQDCATCQRLLEELTQPAPQMSTLDWPGASGTDSLDAQFRQQLFHLLQDRPTSSAQPSREPTLSDYPLVPGYELVEELGRGGMGVVFKARQTGLNRLVALKMVLGGTLLDTERLARFRREAEAIAQLQHPYIVQIYEIGSLEGQPFFALEYVPGGSLDRYLQGQPQLPHEAAALVEKLAEAMQAAHERGIIHRDLKPANVLLTFSRAPKARVLEETESALDSPARASGARQNELNEAVPKITDFGLAKRLETEAGHTKSGDIVGTPSYMAPEQAAGRAKEVSPAADIYALGAILYEMLTGRPPFKGVTPMETVLQVLHEEPLPPSRLQPKLPADLETICLKCLRKEIPQRYVTAQALAEDLRRFLDNRPILARPVGRAERTWRWCRRNPVLASLAGLLLLAGLGLVIGFLLLWQSYDRLAESQKETQAALTAEAKRRKQARDALDATTNKVMFDLLAGQQQLKQEDKSFLRDVLARYRELAAETGNNTESRAEVARAYLRVGDILRRLGEDADAEQSYRQAIERYLVVVQEAPHATEYRHGLAGVYHNLAQMLVEKSLIPQARVENDREARVLIERCITLSRKLVEDNPGNVLFAINLGLSYETLGKVLERQNHRREAQEQFQSALQLYRAARQKEPANMEVQYRLCSTMWNAAALHAKQGEMKTALALHEEGDSLARQLVQRQPTFGNRRNQLDGLIRYANLLGPRGQIKAARAKLEEANRVGERLVRDLPASPEQRSAWGEVLFLLGSLDCEQNNVVLGEQRLQQGKGLFVRLSEDNPQVPYYRSQIAAIAANLGLVHMNRKEFEAARKEYALAIPLYERLLTDDRTTAEYRDRLVVCYSRYGELLKNLKDYPAAKKAYEDQERLLQRFLTDNPKDTIYTATLGYTWCKMGDLAWEEGNPQTALPCYDKSIAILSAELQRKSPHPLARKILGDATMGRARTFTRLRRYSDALADLDRLKALQTGAFPPNIRVFRALALVHTNGLEEALAEAQALAPRKDLSAEYHFALSRIWAVAARKAAYPSPNQEEYAATAVQHLRQAQAKGLFQGEKGRQQLHSEDDFSALQQRPDFRKLLEDLPLPSPGQKPHNKSASFVM